MLITRSARLISRPRNGSKRRDDADEARRVQMKLKLNWKPKPQDASANRKKSEGRAHVFTARRQLATLREISAGFIRLIQKIIKTF